MPTVNQIRTATNLIKDLRLGESAVPRAYLGSTVIWEDLSAYPLTITCTVAGGFELLNTGTAKTIQMRKNYGSWSSISVGGGSSTYNISCAVGDVFQFRGTNNSYRNFVFRQSSSGNTNTRLKLSGNLMSLCGGEDFKDTIITSDQAFYSTFSTLPITDASGLVLPTNTTYECYRSMFHGCSYLVYPPVLPATSLTAGGEYSWMFQNCTSLVTTPALPATTVSAGSYQGMFQGCTSLTETPYLPALTLAQACYASMFYRCTGITKMNELPATTLAKGCYSEFVSSCTNLRIAPRVLPALTLAESCYSYMFNGCTKLGRAPILPAATLVKDCYDYMFYNCSSLRRIECYALGTNPSTSSTSEYNSNYTASWVKGVASRGTYYKPLNSSSWPRGTYGYPSGWAIDTAHEFTPLTIEFFTATGAAAGGTFKWIKSDPEAPTLFLTYWNSLGTDGNSLESTTSGVTIQTNGTQISLYQDDTYGTGEYNTTHYNYLSITSGYAVMYGRLLDMAAGGPAVSHTCFKNLFNGSTGLIAADLYIPETVTPHEYENLFKGCTNLGAYNYGLIQLMKNRGFTCPPRYVPKLPATTLAPYCYYQMFYGCTSLTDPPELPATTLAQNCYIGMFEGCSALKECPRLPATTLAVGCYQRMFSGSDIHVAPELPATTLATQCYDQMFMSCTELVIAPEILPATTLAVGCYQGMFQGCIRLYTAPILPAQTLVTNCYKNMFYGCNSLSYIECYATNISAADCLLNWLYKSSDTTKGLFIGGSTHATFPTGASGIPSNWAVYYGDLYSKLFTIYNTTANTITISWKNSGGNTRGLYFRIQASGSTIYSAWGAVLAAGGSLSIAPYDKVEFRGENSTTTALGTASSYNYFSVSGAVIVYGNIGSLLSNSTTVTRGTTASYGSLPYAFRNLFYNNGLQAGKEIYAQGLKFPYRSAGTYTYQWMFYYTKLMAAPNLPMASVGEYGYYQMYRSCTSLMDPGRIKALKLAQRACAYMYAGCTSLLVTPELPATNIGQYTYTYMFQGCSDLVIPTKYLPAVDIQGLHAYETMFSACTVLLRTPILTDSSCSDYSYMFGGCTNLKKITIYSTTFTSWSTTVLNLPSNLMNCLIITDIASSISSPPGTNCQVVKVNSNDDLVNEVWLDDFPSSSDFGGDVLEGETASNWAADPYNHGSNRWIRTGGTIWIDGVEYAIYEYLGYGYGYSPGIGDFWYSSASYPKYGLVPLYDSWTIPDHEYSVRNSVLFADDTDQYTFFKIKLEEDGSTYWQKTGAQSNGYGTDVITAVVS